MTRPRLPSIGALSAFESAARHLSFRRAADELHLTQGAVSQQVRLLEEQLAFALFARVRQRVILTSAGERYLKEVRRLLKELEEATNQAKASGDKETLNLAAVPTFAVKWLVPRLTRFFAQHPEINLNLVSRSAPFDFEREPFDAAIHYGEPSWSGTVATALMPEDMIAVCSRRYRRSQRLRTPADLARATLLQQFTRPSAWLDWFAQLDMAPADALQGPRFDSFNMIFEAVHAHLGAALLPRFLVQADLAAGSVVQLFGHALPSTRQYFFVCPEAKREARAVQAFRGWLLEELQRETP